MGIFISYRRDDTGARAQHLYSDLSNRFGSRHVFMDIHGIRAGSEWKQRLEEELGGCEVLLALIGRKWLTCTRDDKRRLDFADDWVRNEIRSCLDRGAPVLPVLLDRADPPAEHDLPEDLRPMLARQCGDVDGRHWSDGIDALVAAILEVSGLRELKPVADDLASARESLDKLRELVQRNVPVVVDAVGRSKEVVRVAEEQLTKLEVYKTIHDALHEIEFDCLHALQEAEGSVRRLRPYKFHFSGARDRILPQLDSSDLNRELSDQIRDDLEAAWAIFAGASSPEEGAVERLISILHRLVSGPPPKLDMGISEAAKALRLDRLVTLMTEIRGVLVANDLAQDAELGPLGDGIQALGRLHEDLSSRVEEHSRLQGLDAMLRALCVGETAVEIDAWNRILRARNRISPPFSPQLATMHGDLLEIEAEVNEALAGAGRDPAGDLIKEYFYSLGSVFKAVDGRLKELALDLTRVGGPIRTMLEFV